MFTKQDILQLQKELHTDTERLAVVFNALGDPGRFRIFSLLLEYKGICVSEIAGVLDITVSAVSQQFRILEMSGLVRKERMGQKICYAVRQDDSLVRSLTQLVRKYKVES
jgi:ArsR family transcriptional regulator, lead/cadmium/zinc/bismuth-responsive transcriptional repressor